MHEVPPGRSLARKLIAEKHSVPIFEGKQSRRHRSVPLGWLALQAAPGALRKQRRYRAVQAFAQFAAFPRCGHSLIGSIIDAHPAAVVSHELDTMGLLARGMPAGAIFSLVERNSAEFARNGRWWNGFRYAVPGRHHGRSDTLRVIGDKKGDWAVRWLQREPDLLRVLRDRIRMPCKWILVTRHPLDNIATMSLRRSSEFDRLRIASAGATEFLDALRDGQSRGEVPSRADDAVIDDFEGLCGTIENLCLAVRRDEWHQIRHEDLVSDPRAELELLLRFLDLDPEDSFLENAVSVVHATANRSRDNVAWSGRQLARVSTLVERFPFLHGYSFER